MSEVLMDIVAADRAPTVKSGNLKRKTPDQVEKELDEHYRRGEIIERKRLPPSSFRLHASKFLHMDKMLKSLFFPLRTLRNHFGLTSYSDCNRLDAEDLLGIDKVVSGALRTKGNYRGVAFFSIRNTDPNCTPNTIKCLNGDPQQLGGVRDGAPPTASHSVDSIYRSFHNGPALTGGSLGTTYDGSSVVDGASQNFTDEDDKNQSLVRSLSMGINLSQIEEASLNGMCYADPVVSNSRLAIPASPVLNQDNTETIPGQVGIQAYQNSPFTSKTPGSVTYNYQVANGVVRIVDGSLVMDIMNTENTPCVVEFVIHAKKKNNLTKQAIYHMFQEDYERLHAAKGVTSDVSGSGNLSGGWQTFYDPEVPLMKLPKKSNVYNYVTEVHRSHHVLAPGQSKLVSVKLGSLWYKIANKNDMLFTGNDPNRQFVSHIDNVGTLFCSLGHSGFNSPQGIQAIMNGPTGSGTIYTQAFMSPGTDYTPVVNGSGWWAGLAHAPSSIIVSGKYEESFYPMTFDRSDATTTRGFANRAAVFNKDGTTNKAVVPVTHILPTKTVTADSAFKSNSFREEL